MYCGDGLHERRQVVLVGDGVYPLEASVLPEESHCPSRPLKVRTFSHWIDSGASRDEEIDYHQRTSATWSVLAPILLLFHRWMAKKQALLSRT